MFDTLLRNADIIDGTGASPYRADVGLREGRISAIGDLRHSEAVRTIDVGGLAVSPGFIDLHTHVDASIHDAPAAEAYLRQGVTLTQMGNCGFSAFPAGSSPVPLKRRDTDPSLDLAWGWPDLPAFLESVSTRQPGINYSAQVGHLALRTAVVGPTGRRATRTEVDAMVWHLKRAAAAGATGFSLGLLYSPGRFADAEELQALATAAAESGLLISVHLRNEGDQLIDAIDEILSIATAASARLQISHLKATGRKNHGSVGRAIERIELARHAALDVAVDVYPYTASSTSLSSRLPDWAVEGGPEDLLHKLSDPSLRARIVEELAGDLAEHTGPGDVYIADVGRETGESIVGFSLAELGLRWSVEPAEAAVRIIEQHGITQIVEHSMAEEDLVQVLQYTHCAIGSDGKELASTGNSRPHPRSFGTFPRVLARYVRDQGVMSPEEAVRRMTSLPAARLGLSDRGVIAQGNWADLVVFDLDTLRDHSTFERPWQLATGVQHLFVNGDQAIAEGRLTAVRAGRFVPRHDQQAPNA